MVLFLSLFGKTTPQTSKQNIEGLEFRVQVRNGQRSHLASDRIIIVDGRQTMTGAILAHGHRPSQGGITVSTAL